MTPGSLVRVARTQPDRNHMVAYIDRTGEVVKPFTQLKDGFVAVLLNPPATMPCAFSWRMVFHVDELDIVAKEAI